MGKDPIAQTRIISLILIKYPFSWAEDMKLKSIVAFALKVKVRKKSILALNHAYGSIKVIAYCPNIYTTVNFTFSLSGQQGTAANMS